MLRPLSSIRRRVEQMATQGGSGRCDGNHQRHRIVHVQGGEPAPVGPEAEDDARCACGAELEYAQVVHQHISDDGTASSVVH